MLSFLAEKFVENKINYQSKHYFVSMDWSNIQF